MSYDEYGTMCQFRQLWSARPIAVAWRRRAPTRGPSSASSTRGAPVGHWPGRRSRRSSRWATSFPDPRAQTGTRSLALSSGSALRRNPEYAHGIRRSEPSGSRTSPGTWFWTARGLASWVRPGSRRVPVPGRGFGPRETSEPGPGHAPGASGRGTGPACRLRPTTPLQPFGPLMSCR